MSGESRPSPKMLQAIFGSAHRQGCYCEQRGIILWTKVRLRRLQTGPFFLYMQQPTARCGLATKAGAWAVLKTDIFPELQPSKVCLMIIFRKLLPTITDGFGLPV